MDFFKLQLPWEVVCGDALTTLRTLPNESVQTIITSPPYFGLRSYEADGQIGIENSPQEYVARLVEVFHEVHRILSSNGTLWLNLGDSFSKRINKNGLTDDDIKMPFSISPKNLLGIPWRVAIALQDDGWILRSDIIWEKPNCLPESVNDRPTRSHEHIFLLSKSQHYYYDADAIREPYINGDVSPPRGSKGVINNPLNSGRRMQNAERLKAVENVKNGRNKRDVWRVSIKAGSNEHYATFPVDLVEHFTRAFPRLGAKRQTAGQAGAYFFPCISTYRFTVSRFAWPTDPA